MINLLIFNFFKNYLNKELWWKNNIKLFYIMNVNVLPLNLYKYLFLT